MGRMRSTGSITFDTASRWLGSALMLCACQTSASDAERAADAGRATEAPAKQRDAAAAAPESDAASAEPQPSADDAAERDASEEAAPPKSAAPAPQCNASLPANVLGIAAVPLQHKQPLELTETTQLTGEGLELTLAPQQNVSGALRYSGDRMFVMADAGFWDVDPMGEPRFYTTSSVLLWGLRAGDLDRDGDQDLIVLTLEPNDMPSTNSNTPMPFVSRLSAWERSADGLTQRDDVMRTTEMRFAMPYALGDVDGDDDLDVVGFEQGTPVAFMHDGAFHFERQALGVTTAELTSSVAISIDYSDRNADGHSDMLVVLGSYTGNQLENRIHVLLADANGKLGAPGPVRVGETPLVPHGPDGVGMGAADVTGDGVSDLLQQDDQSSPEAPVLRLYASQGASELAEAVELEGLGFELADVDEDGKLDIVSTLNERLIVLYSRGRGAFESSDLGVSMAAPDVADYVVDPGVGKAPAVLYTLYKLRDCPACDDACSGRCVFGVCVECLSDADCASDRCAAQRCEEP
jgi:hypothetical protein